MNGFTQNETHYRPSTSDHNYNYLNDVTIHHPTNPANSQSDRISNQRRSSFEQTRTASPQHYLPSYQTRSKSPYQLNQPQDPYNLHGRELYNRSATPTEGRRHKRKLHNQTVDSSTYSGKKGPRGASAPRPSSRCSNFEKPKTISVENESDTLIDAKQHLKDLLSKRRFLSTYTNTQSSTEEAYGRVWPPNAQNLKIHASKHSTKTQESMYQTIMDDWHPSELHSTKQGFYKDDNAKTKTEKKMAVLERIYTNSVCKPQKRDKQRNISMLEGYEPVYQNAMDFQTRARSAQRQRFEHNRAPSRNDDIYDRVYNQNNPEQRSASVGPSQERQESAHISDKVGIATKPTAKFVTLDSNIRNKQHESHKTNESDERKPQIITMPSTADSNRGRFQGNFGGRGSSMSQRERSPYMTPTCLDSYRTKNSLTPLENRTRKQSQTPVDGGRTGSEKGPHSQTKNPYQSRPYTPLKDNGGSRLNQTIAHVDAAEVESRNKIIGERSEPAKSGKKVGFQRKKYSQPQPQKAYSSMKNTSTENAYQTKYHQKGMSFSGGVHRVDSNENLLNNLSDDERTSKKSQPLTKKSPYGDIMEGSISSYLDGKDLENSQPKVESKMITNVIKQLVIKKPKPDGNIYKRRSTAATSNDGMYFSASEHQGSKNGGNIFGSSDKSNANIDFNFSIDGEDKRSKELVQYFDSRISEHFEEDKERQLDFLGSVERIGRPQLVPMNYHRSKDFEERKDESKQSLTAYLQNPDTQRTEGNPILYDSANFPEEHFETLTSNKEFKWTRPVEQKGNNDFIRVENESFTVDDAPDFFTRHLP